MNLICNIYYYLAWAIYGGCITSFCLKRATLRHTRTINPLLRNGLHYMKMLVISFLCLEFSFQSTETVPELCYFTKNVEPSDTDYDVFQYSSKMSSIKIDHFYSALHPRCCYKDINITILIINRVQDNVEYIECINKDLIK